MKFRPKVLLAKKESVYGTDSTPDGATNAIEIVEAEIEPLRADEIEHLVDRQTLGNYLSSLVGKHVVVRFKVAVAGAGDGVNPDTPPAWGVLMEGCGMEEAVTVATSVAYTPIDSGEDSLSMYFFTTQARHILLGARGTVSIALVAKQYLYWQFEFTGLWSAPSAQAFPTIDLSGFTTPLPVTNANTTLTVDGETPILRSLNWGVNNEVMHLDLPGEESVKIVDRRPGGDQVIDAPPLADKNWFSVVTAGEPVALSLQHGQSAGNIVTLNGPQTQLSSINNANNDGELGHQLNMRMIPTDAGQDDFEIVCT